MTLRAALYICNVTMHKLKKDFEYCFWCGAGTEHRAGCIYQHALDILKQTPPDEIEHAYRDLNKALARCGYVQ